MYFALQNRIADHSSKKQNSFSRFRFWLFILILIWCTGFLYPTLNPSSENILFYALLKHNYSLVCHQSDQKTISIGGDKILVCARCTGIYFGALIISLFFVLTNFKNKINLKYLFAALLITLLDVLSVNVGIYSYSKEISFVTGVILGVAVLFLITEVLEEYIDSRKGYSFS